MGVDLVFVFTFKTNKGKLAIALLAIVVLFSLLLVLVFSGNTQNSYAVSSDFRYSTNGDTNDARTRFLQQFGWDASKEPVEARQVLIPESFSEAYENYNSIQVRQGLDLKEYAGRRVKCYTYEIYNFPTEEGDRVVANLLVYQGKVIGGDISSTKASGFIQGFVNNAVNPLPTPEAQELQIPD